MKGASCARCGRRIIVPNTFDPDEEMKVCLPCEGELYDEWAEEHVRPTTEDTDPL